MKTYQNTARKSPTPRVSVSLPHDVHSALEQIAQEKKVSVAWVVRDAVDKYFADKWPLFARPRGE